MNGRAMYESLEKPLRAAAWLAVLAAGTAAQSTGNPDAPTRAPAKSLASSWRQLRDRLDAPDPAPPAPLLSVDARADLLVKFVDTARPKDSNDRLALLQARCRLGHLELARLDANAAAARFREVLSAGDAAGLDLRGRATYGSALALELGGDVEAARRAHRALAGEFLGTRYEDWSRTQLARLDRDRGLEVRVGGRFPEPAARTDVDGRSRRLKERYGDPRLLCVWSADDTAGAQRIAAVESAALAGGLPADAIHHVILHASAVRARRAASGNALRGVLLPSGRETLDPTVLRYGLTSTPSWFLIGPDDTLLARDVPPGRLGALARALTGRSDK